MKHPNNQAGFSLIEGLLLFVAAAIIAGTGYYVWHSKQVADKNLSSTPGTAAFKKVAAVTDFASCKAAPGSKLLETYPEQCVTSSGKKFTNTAASSQNALSQTYTSSDYKFSFKYPASWKLATDLKDIGRGGLEGDIRVTSPAGTIVHFGPDFGGKGGDCIDDQTDTRTTRTCTTRTIIGVTSLPNPGIQPIYLVKASDTAPTRDGGKTTYFVYLSSGYDKPIVGTNLGAFMGTYDDVNMPRADLTVYVEGKDDQQNSSPDFFSSNEVTEAIPVLESLNIQQ